MRAIITAAVIAATAGTATANVAGINGLNQQNRIFNDFSTSNLIVTDNYPATFHYDETNLVDDAQGGNFANKHAAWLSDDAGATAFDFNYDDSFDLKTTVVDSSSGLTAEVGIVADLFGFGFFGGGLSNGEIAAFGSTLPFHSFGTGLYTAGDTLDLRIIYRAGATEFVDTSTIEYRYQVNGGGWVSSGEKPYTNTEMGIPSGTPESQFIQKFGLGVQFNNAEGGTGDVLFSNIMVSPTPGTAALLGLAGLAGIRRRR